MILAANGQEIGVGAFVISIFVLTTLFGLAAFLRRPTHNLDHAPGKVGWRPWESITVTVAIFLLGQMAGGLIAYIIGLLAMGSHEAALTWLEKDAFGQFLAIAIIEIISLLMLGGFLKRRHNKWADIGLKDKPKWRDLAYIAIGFAVYFGLLILTTSILSQVFSGLDTNQKQELGFESVSGLQLIWVFLSLVVWPPITEELLVRGFLFTGLRRYWSAIPAALVASLLFGAAHLQPGSDKPLLWVAAIDTFVLSLVLIFVRVRTGNLWAAMGIHALKNGVAFLALFVFHVAK